LSNFHVIKEGFQIDGEIFDCTERYFQMHRAIFAETQDVVRKIRHAKGPLQCKILGDSVTVDENQWLPHARQVMHTACSAKFRQHEPSRNFLLETGDSRLTEASPNRTWGIGLKMNNPDASKADKWLGQNILGEILASVRADIRLMTLS
jgi:ribA/ribD-fused uncharacterized protein